jgi:hypothetical protein
LWRLRYFDNNVRDGILQPFVVGISSRDFAVAGLVVDSLDHRLRNRGTARSEGSFATAGSQGQIACVHSGCASASLAFRDHLYLVRNSVLESLVVCIRARNFAVARFVINPLYTGSRYRRGGFRPLIVSKGASRTAFGCVGEVLVAFGCFWTLRSDLSTQQLGDGLTKIMSARVLQLSALARRGKLVGHGLGAQGRLVKAGSTSMVFDIKNSQAGVQL